jgi:hypothetical protein
MQAAQQQLLLQLQDRRGFLLESTTYNMYMQHRDTTGTATKNLPNTLRN